MSTDVLIIGAGPAGLAAAIAAARALSTGSGRRGGAGQSVTVLEKNDLPGRKLLLTGGGRCNLVDPARPALDALAEFGRGGAFLRDALARFNFAGFLADLGVATELDPRDGHHYVVGGARKMLDALLAAAETSGAHVVAGTRVNSVRRTPHGFTAAPAGSPWHGRRIILAAGGMTYPATGSSGDAYPWALSLGHGIDAPTPALAGLATKPCFAGLAGITVADAKLTLMVGGKKSGARRGTILFTHGGISGPAAVDLSLDLARADVAHPPPGVIAGVAQPPPAGISSSHAQARAPVPHKPHGPAEVVVDFLPAATLGEVEAHLTKRGRHAASRALEGFAPAGQIPSRLALELVRASGVLTTGPLDHASKPAIIALARALKSTRLAVTGIEDPANAMITLGGVAVKDIHPRTLESRLVPGLFFAGEFLSPAGPCGGFNLLLAFATGTLAGKSVTSDK